MIKISLLRTAHYVCFHVVIIWHKLTSLLIANERATLKWLPLPKGSHNWFLSHQATRPIKRFEFMVTQSSHTNAKPPGKRNGPISLPWTSYMKLPIKVAVVWDPGFRQRVLGCNLSAGLQSISQSASALFLATRFAPVPKTLLQSLGRIVSLAAFDV